MRTLDEVREALTHRGECDADCPGWGVFHVDREPFTEIQVCDSCAGNPEAGEHRLTDFDVGLLPEARWALSMEVLE